jgi:hypothetical protein
MHIDAAGMAWPDRVLAFQFGSLGRMVLLDAQVLDAVPGTTQGGDELGPAVLEGLSPLGLAGSDRQQTVV